MKKKIVCSSSTDFTAALLAILFLFYCSACRNSQTEKIHIVKKMASTPVVYKKPACSFNDTLIINTKSAVFFLPDSLQLKNIKSITDERIFQSNEHDCFYQMRNARIVLKKNWPQIHIIETSKARFLLFMKTDNKKIFIDLDAKGDMCGIFLFKSEKEPELVDMTNIDTALEFYFNK